MNTCPFCNNAIDLDSTFCPHCGRNVSALNTQGPSLSGKRKWLVAGLVACFGILAVGVALWAQGGSAGWLTAKLGLTQPAAFPAGASTGGCCAKPATGGGCGMIASGAGCGGGGCGSGAANISDDEAYKAAESVFAYWAARYNENDLKVEVLNKGCHVEMQVFLKEAPLKAYKYANGNITAI